MAYCAKPLFGVTTAISCALVAPLLPCWASSVTMLAQQVALCATFMLAAFAPTVVKWGTLGAGGVLAAGAGVGAAGPLTVLLAFLVAITLVPAPNGGANPAPWHGA